MASCGSPLLSSGVRGVPQGAQPPAGDIGRTKALTLARHDRAHRTPARPAARRAAGARQHAGWRRPGRRGHQPNANAMVLATATPDGQPERARGAVQGHRAAARATSCSTPTTCRARGASSTDNPRAAAVMHWDALHRQVRIEGPVCARAGGRQRCLLRLALLAEAASAPGPARRASRSPRARQLIARSPRAARRFGTPDARHARPPMPPSTSTSRGRRTGAAIACGPSAVELWVEGDARMHDRARWQRALLAAQADGTFRGGAWSATRLQP